jgi:hypothetical protein
MADYDQVDIKVLRKVIELLTAGASTAEVFLDPAVIDMTLEQIKEVESVLKSGARNSLTKFEDTGKSSILNYNVPNSTSYKGLRYVFLRDPNLDGPEYDWFKEETKK